jgi:hypothetical protein
MHIIFLNGLIMVTLTLLTLLLFVSGNHSLISLCYYYNKSQLWILEVSSSAEPYLLFV